MTLSNGDVGMRFGVGISRVISLPTPGLSWATTQSGRLEPTEANWTRQVAMANFSRARCLINPHF
jgi:hypothetical protein